MTVLCFDAWRPARDPGDAHSAVTAGDVVEALTQAPAGDLLVVAGDARTVRAVQVGVGTLRRPGVAVVDLTGPPTRRYTLMFALRHLSPEAYGYADAVLSTVQRICSTRALLSSVARLTEPYPGLVDHVAGWLPGQFFAVDVDGRSVTRQREPELALEVGDLAVVAAHWDRPEQPVLAPLPPSCVELDGPLPSAQWRARQWAEVTIARAPVASTVQHALTWARPRPCPSCARPSTGITCRFCGVPIPGDQVQTPPPPGALTPSTSEESFA